MALRKKFRVAKTVWRDWETDEESCFYSLKRVIYDKEKRIRNAFNCDSLDFIDMSKKEMNATITKLIYAIRKNCIVFNEKEGIWEEEIQT